MATPSEKLVASLEALQAIQSEGRVAIRSQDLSRTHRERLLQNVFLEQIVEGWYIAARPDEVLGKSTAWYTAFWPFVAAYLNYLKGNDGCLSSEQSLSLHVENWTIPRQLLVRAVKEGVRMYSLPMALIACGPDILCRSRQVHAQLWRLFEMHLKC